MTRFGREDRGLVTLETTLMVVILVPLLFGVIEFGWLFQRWLAAGGTKKKGADRGIDGVITFAERDGIERILASVKSGHVNVSQVRDLVGTIEREKAAMGILVTLEDATKPMQQEAISAGYYHSELWAKDFPKVQIVTVRELLMGKLPALPPSASAGFQRAERIRPREDEHQLTLGGEPVEVDEEDSQPDD